MAYMNQEKKAAIKAALDPVLKKHGIKASLRVRDRMVIVCTIKSGSVDFFKDSVYRPEGTYIKVNQYHFENHFSGESVVVVRDVLKALNVGNYNNSDIQSDYFDVGHYVDLSIGNWEKGYELNI